jgi:hypothetical protein
MAWDASIWTPLGAAAFVEVELLHQTQARINAAARASKLVLRI